MIDHGATDQFMASLGDGQDLLIIGEFDDYLPLGPSDLAVKL